MPARKRSLSVSDGDRDDHVSQPTTDALQSPYADSRKRPRANNHHPPTDQVPDDSDSSSSDDDFTSSESDPDYDLENDLEYQRVLSEKIREKYSKIRENAPNDNGILEGVECVNFMCHKHFSVELGPLINFIVGKNGSGKSAILTAITLCLGGKASVTNRGQSLKSFIKEGEEVATIIVRIKNQGESYRFNDFGQSIVVERSFSRNGTSGFKLKNVHGRIVSTRKADLDGITDYFALQIDNPVNVLSQDMARQFLGSSNKHEKYKFFVKGVQLEQLDNDYKLIEESLDHTNLKVTAYLEDFEIAKKELSNAKAKLDLSDRYLGLQSKIDGITAKMVWAHVFDEESSRDAILEEIKEHERSIAASEDKVKQATEAFESREGEEEEQKGQIERLHHDLRAVREKRNGIKEAVEEAQRTRHKLQSEDRTIRSSIKGMDEQIAKTKREIEEEEAALAQQDGGVNAALQRELEEKEHRFEHAKAELESHLNTALDVTQRVRDAQNAHLQASQPLQQQQAELQQAERRLTALVRDQGQQQFGFYENMPQLLRAIEREKSAFSHPPVGPLGHFVRLLEPGWSGILESVIGASMNHFIVRNKRDEQILSNIMQRVRCQCTISILSSFERLDTSSNEPDRGFRTILRILEFDQDCVQRQLVITGGIDQVLLIEDVEEASKIMFDGPRPPRFARRCYSIDRADKRRGYLLQQGISGGPSQSPVQRYEGYPRMKSDSKARIRAQEDVVDTLRQGLHGLGEQQRAAKAHLQQCVDAQKLHARQERELRLAAQEAEDQLAATRDKLSEDRLTASRLEGLKQMLVDAEDERKIHQSSFQDAIAARETIVPQIKQMRRELQEEDNTIANLAQQISDLETLLAKTGEKLQRALQIKNRLVVQINHIKEQIAHSRQRHAKLSSDIDDAIEQASLISPRMSLQQGETMHSLHAKRQRLQEDRSRYENQIGGTREEILKLLDHAKEKHDNISWQIDAFQETLALFKCTLNERRRRWGKFRAHITTRAKSQFVYLLSERTFRGRILADHKQKALDIQVEPDINKGNSLGREAKTLSGGEKSFSQICFLLALWEAMGSPIRCLDEFDVFMDPVNRKTSIDMLMASARSSPGKQFILITPGSRTDIKTAPDVRVKELAAPLRGQSTLSFARQD